MIRDASYSHGCGNNMFHLVLVPYKRFKVFKREDIRQCAKNLFVAIARKHRFTIYEMEVVEDHVHIFLEIRPSQSISQVIQCLKGISSRHLREVFPELEGFSRKYLWSKGKFFRPISDVSPETIQHYIADSQSKHHNVPRTRTWLRPYTRTRITPQKSLDDFAS